MRHLFLILLLAIPQFLVAQPNRIDSLRMYAHAMDEAGDRDGALGYYSRAVALMLEQKQIRERIFWDLVQDVIDDVEILYNPAKALEMEDKFLNYLKYHEIIPDNQSFSRNLQSAQSLAFAVKDYGRAIYYGRWLICQMEACTPLNSQEYYSQCLSVYECYRLMHRPLDDCYKFLETYGNRCREITGTIPPDFVEQQILLDIESHSYATALQNISGLRQYYYQVSDTALYEKLAENLLQGSRLFATTNQCDKALEYLRELSQFMDSHGIQNRRILHNLHLQYGLIYQQKDLSDSAIESYSQALRFHTDQPDCYDGQIFCFLQQASSYEQKGDNLKALSLSNKACRYSSVNKSLKSADISLQSRIAYLYYKAWLGNVVDYQALLEFGNKIADRNDPALTSKYVNAVAKVCPKFGDAKSNDILLRILCRMQTDEITQKLLQIAEDGKYLSIKGNVDNNNLIFSLHRANNDSQNGLLYNLCLTYKGAVLSSIIQLGKAVEKSDRQDLKNLYQRVRDLKSLKSRYSLESSHRADSVSSLLFDAENLLMREMLSNSGNYLTSKTWNDIQKSLKNNEMAVEFFDYQKVLPDLRYEPGHTYGALIIRPGIPQPICLELFNDTIFRDAFRHKNHSLHSEPLSQKLRSLILEPLLSIAQKGYRIYYSPSGFLYNIALENLQDSLSRPAYLDYDLRRVSSTGEIVCPASESSPSKVLLFGDISYGLSVFGRGFGPIPGTRREVDNIARQMKASGISVTNQAREKASEEAFKSLGVSGYDIIHLATHGFFLRDSAQVSRNVFFSRVDDNTISRNPLLRSGLALAGANRAWNGERIPNGVDDGILTAQEIKDLDLSKTQMVVLSACETGLGDINTDGVFGLQRAFKSAGVQTIVMSLWKVSDNATSLLMTEFYKGLLASGDRHKAFLQAKEAVRARFPEAYYWAGFVMLD